MDYGNLATGALSGAGTGATIGSLIPGIGTAIGAGVGGLIGAAGTGLAGRKKKEETSIQKKQRELVDQLLSSLSGQGPYSNLFSANESDFEKSFAEPARARFRNQTAPQIQQSYIASGQQRGTGLQDELARAGVDMDALINQSYMDFKQGAQNRQVNAIGSVLGQGAGASPGQSYGQAALQGVGGYLSGDTFPKDIQDILNAFKNQKKQTENTFEQPRKGFENDNYSIDPYMEKFT